MFCWKRERGKLSLDYDGTLTFCWPDGVGVRVGVYNPETDTLKWNWPAENSSSGSGGDFYGDTPFVFTGKSQKTTQSSHLFFQINTQRASPQIVHAEFGEKSFGKLFKV